MKPTTLACALLGLMTTITPNIIAADPFRFLPDPMYFQLPDSITLGACSGVAVNSRDYVYLFHRGKQPIICLAPNGKFVRAWGDDTIDTAHGLRIDADDNVWVTDIGNHQVMKFSPEGKRLLTLGKAGSPGDGIDEFNKPTDVGFGPAGEIYVTDGYGNNRVIKFTANGGFLAQWGEAGTDPGQFNLPHTVVVKQNGRVLVGDRENDRVQVFESNGKLVAVWPGLAPYGLAYDRQGHLFVADGRANKVIQLDDDGKIVRSWGRQGRKPFEFQLPHMLATNARGDLFVAEIKGERFQRLIRR